MTHKHEDLKLTAVRYYLDNDTTYAETCRIFNCSERSLKRWIDRFQDEDEIKRHNREPISYKVDKEHVDKEHVDYAIRILRSNEQINMVDLDKILRDQFEDFDITPQHLGQILRDNNKTRKRTRKEHFPETRYGKPMSKCFTNGQRIKHTTACNHKTWIGIYDSSKNGIVYDTKFFKSISAFAETHNSVDRPDRTKAANGWSDCECEIDGKWISTFNL